jgi:hypothetical protein
MSSDLPEQGLFQQRNARPISGEHLEVLGKKASADWSAGTYSSLTAAVTNVVKTAGLSPEQVKRVVEFANTSAYLNEFRKEGSAHRVIEFEGGPASVADVLRDLNDGGGGSVFDRGTLDYQTPPSNAKVAAARAEAELTALFGSPAPDLPQENPLGPALDLQTKVASAREHLLSQLSGLEVVYSDLGDRLYFQVKQAALRGMSLGDIVQAWDSVAPSADHIKVASSLVAPRLLKDEVFRNIGELHASIDKMGGARMVNPAHPLVGEFVEFCQALNKLAETRLARDELAKAASDLSTFIKQASDVSLGTKAMVGGAGTLAALHYANKHYNESPSTLATVARYLGERLSPQQGQVTNGY